MSGTQPYFSLSVFGDLGFRPQLTCPYFRRSRGRQVPDRDDQGTLGDTQRDEESIGGLDVRRKEPEGTIQTPFVRTWHTKILALST